jgi:hypothetical protein
MNKSIVALIPLKDGHVLYYDVLKSLMNQTVKVEIMCISRPIESLESKIRPNNGFISMTKCRNLLKQQSLEQYNDDKFLLLNRDVILKNNTDIEEMMNFLDKNKKYVGVALNTRNYDIDFTICEYSHVDIACMVIKRNILEKIEYNNNYWCNCKSLLKDIQRLKLGNLTYLDNRQLKEFKD